MVPLPITIVLSAWMSFASTGTADSQQVAGSYNHQCDSLLCQARALQDKDQFLDAAKIFLEAQQSCTDSNHLAEALYRFISCGDAQVNLLECGTGTDKLPGFRSIGMNIVYLQWNETWVNADTTIRQLLTSAFSRTPWGEAAAFELIHGERYPDGMWKVDHPRIVLQRSQDFLRKYPNSKYRFDAEHLLAFALQDLWNLSLEGNGGYLTDEEQTKAELYRSQAIGYLESVSKHRGQLLHDPWNEMDDRILARLRNRQDTGIGFFLIVD